MRYSNCVEKFLLHGLTQCAENDYLGAFNFVSIKKDIEVDFEDIEIFCLNRFHVICV